MSKRVKDETIIQLLKTVRNNLDTGYYNQYNPFICNQVLDIAHGNVGYKEAAKYVRRWIKRMLGKPECLEVWMSINYPGIEHEYDPIDTTNDKYIEARIQWLDWMINEVERTKS